MGDGRWACLLRIGIVASELNTMKIKQDHPPPHPLHLGGCSGSKRGSSKLQLRHYARGTRPFSVGCPSPPFNGLLIHPLPNKYPDLKHPGTQSATGSSRSEFPRRAPEAEMMGSPADPHPVSDTVCCQRSAEGAALCALLQHKPMGAFERAKREGERETAAQAGGAMTWTRPSSPIEVCTLGTPVRTPATYMFPSAPC